MVEKQFIEKAVALKYDKEKDHAPKLTATGKGETAKNIIKIAEKNGIPIKKDEDLVNMLSIAFLGIAQAVDIRGYDKCSKHLQGCYNAVRSEVTKLEEDRRLDLDIKTVNKMLLDGKFA